MNEKERKDIIFRRKQRGHPGQSQEPCKKTRYYASRHGPSEPNVPSLQNIQRRHCHDVLRKYGVVGAFTDLNGTQLVVSKGSVCGVERDACTP